MGRAFTNQRRTVKGPALSINIPKGIALPEEPPSAAGASPVMGMRDGDRERVGGVRRARIGLREQEADNRLDLMLLGMSHADHRLLDQVRRIFGDRKP